MVDRAGLWGRASLLSCWLLPWATCPYTSHLGGVHSTCLIGLWGAQNCLSQRVGYESFTSVSPANSMLEMQASGPPDLRSDPSLCVVHSSECLRGLPAIEKPDLGICTRAKHAGSLFLADPTYPTPVTAQCPVSLIA